MGGAGGATGGGVMAASAAFATTGGLALLELGEGLWSGLLLGGGERKGGLPEAGDELPCGDSGGAGGPGGASGASRCLLDQCCGLAPE